MPVQEEHSIQESVIARNPGVGESKPSTLIKTKLNLRRYKELSVEEVCLTRYFGWMVRIKRLKCINPYMKSPNYD